MVQKIIFSLVLVTTMDVYLWGQMSNLDDCPRCRSAAMIELRAAMLNQTMSPRLKSGTECDQKIVRLNIYYIQDNNGQKNFSTTGDGLGNPLNGKDFAYDMVRRVNENYSINNKLRIPPNNNISADHKDIRFVIEGIYYVRNTALNKYVKRSQNANGSWIVWEPAEYDSLAPLRQGPIDSVIHLFVLGVGERAKEDPPASGRWVLENAYGGGGMSLGGIVKVQTYAKYFSFYAPSGPNVSAPKDWYWFPEGGLWEHELAHEMSLNHTVINLGSTSNAGENFCPTVKDDGFIVPSCDDGLPDSETPSAWYMRDVLNAPIHPAERNGTLRSTFPQWYSNNTMDYNNEHALSPQQIRFMHIYLQQQRPAWLVENAQWSDKIYCSWLGNRIAHYGRRVGLNRNCSPYLRVTAGTNRKVIASQTTEIFAGFEVLSGGEFEIINTCPKP